MTAPALLVTMPASAPLSPKGNLQRLLRERHAIPASSLDAEVRATSAILTAADAENKLRNQKLYLVRLLRG